MVNEEARIRAMLRAYVNAYASLDADAVSRLHPSVNVDALRRSFADSRSFQLDIDQEQITINGNEATATCRVRTRWST